MKAKPGQICTHCGQPSCGRYYEGICEACYAYKRRTGVSRPTSTMRRKNKGKLCGRCRQEGARYKGLCKKCYQYKWANGRARPRYRYITEHCLVCGRPKPDTPAQFLRAGRCSTCHAYWQKHRRERSEELIRKVAPLGWCECSKPARRADVLLQTMTGDGYERAEKYNLCNDCYALEFGGEATWNR
jgi:hypothetical protein